MQGGHALGIVSAVQQHIGVPADQFHAGGPHRPLQSLGNGVFIHLPAPPGQGPQSIQRQRGIIQLVGSQQGNVVGALPPVAEGLAVPAGLQHLQGIRCSHRERAVRLTAGLLHYLLHLPALVVEHSGTAPLDDPRLLTGDQGPGIAQLLGVLQADIGDHRRLRGGNHIGGIQAAAQPHLQHHDVAARPQEKLHAQSGHQLKFRGWILHSLSRLDDQLPQLTQQFV